MLVLPGDALIVAVTAYDASPRRWVTTRGEGSIQWPALHAAAPPAGARERPGPSSGTAHRRAFCRNIPLLPPIGTPPLPDPLVLPDRLVPVSYPRALSPLCVIARTDNGATVPVEEAIRMAAGQPLQLHALAQLLPMRCPLPTRYPAGRGRERRSISGPFPASAAAGEALPQPHGSSSMKAAPTRLL
jgi:hypothetical protein